MTQNDSTQEIKAADVIASGIHDVKNSLFDALARIGVAMQSLHAGHLKSALPTLAESERAVAASADRLSKLLSAYRLARHENLVSMLPVDVDSLLEDAVLRVQGSSDNRIAIETECSCHDVWVCDRELVTDCLVNALQNALRFARQRIRLAASVVDGQLSLSVADDGPGLPAQPPNHRDDAHTGVGLFIARRIAELHQRHHRHGTLQVGNGGPLGGAVFELRLP